MTKSKDISPIQTLVEADELEKAMALLRAWTPKLDLAGQREVSVLSGRLVRLESDRRRGILMPAQRDAQRSQLAFAILELMDQLLASQPPTESHQNHPPGPVSTRSAVIRAARVFVSYSDKDDGLRREFFSHLANLQKQGLMESWYDGKMLPGEAWDNKVRRQLDEADIIVLLVSADFLASDHCTGVEMCRALERHAAGTARVIPVIVRPVDWKGSLFAKLMVLPNNSRPITTWENRDEGWVDVTTGIRGLIEIVGQR